MSILVHLALILSPFLYKAPFKSCCESNLITYSLPVAEYTIPSCYFSLVRLLEDQPYCRNEVVLLVTSMYIFQELSDSMPAYQLSKNNIAICCLLERLTSDIDGVMSQLEETAYMIVLLANQQFYKSICSPHLHVFLWL